MEIVEFGIFGGCAVVEGRKGNVRTAKRQGHPARSSMIFIRYGNPTGF